MQHQRLLVAVIASLCLSYPARAESDDGHSHSHRHHRRPYTHGIRNLQEVHPWLFRGGEPPEESFETLYNTGVTTVVDLRDNPRQAAVEQTICTRLGMNFVNIPLSHRTQPTRDQINQFLKIVKTAKEHSGKGSVFVHCQLGEDRTGCMVAISRIALDNYTFNEAYEEMLNLGFHSQFATLTDAVRLFAENYALTNK
jgi:protein-tyrosine phosphatase